METPPGNSNKSKAPPPEREPIEKVVTGRVVIKKKPISKKFKELFMGQDARSAALGVIGDVVMPSIRDLIFDSIRSGAERMLYGESSRRTSRRGPIINTSGMSRISYNAPVIRREDPRDRQRVRPVSYRPDQPVRQSREELYFESRDEAEIVMERMRDVIDLQGYATVSDLYDLIGQEMDHTGNKWGWAHLVGVPIRQTRDGYLIEFPEPDPVG